MKYYWDYAEEWHEAEEAYHLLNKMLRDMLVENEPNYLTPEELSKLKNRVEFPDEPY